MLAMQPPVAVPANGGPWMVALVTRPEGAKVMVRVALPEGSPSLRKEEACAAALFSALTAALRSNSVPGAAGGSALWITTGAFGAGGALGVVGFSLTTAVTAGSA